MVQSAFEQPGDGLEADMGMRRHIHRFSGGEIDRAVGIQEAPGSDRPSLTPREEATDRKPAEVGQASGKDLKGRLDGGLADAQFDFGRRREIAHRGTSSAMIIHPASSPPAQASSHPPARVSGGLTEDGIERGDGSGVGRPPRPACREAGGRGGREQAPYFLPMGTVDVPAGETQPAAEISRTESATLPLLPAVKVIRLVPWPAVIVPFERLQL